MRALGLRFMQFWSNFLLIHIIRRKSLFINNKYVKIVAYIENMFWSKKFSIYSLLWNWRRFVEVKELLAFITSSGLIGKICVAFWQSQSILIFTILLGQVRKSFKKKKGSTKLQYKCLYLHICTVVSTHILHKRSLIKNKWPFVKTLYLKKNYQKNSYVGYIWPL